MEASLSNIYHIDDDTNDHKNIIVIFPVIDDIVTTAVYIPSYKKIIQILLAFDNKSVNF